MKGCILHGRAPDEMPCRECQARKERPEQKEAPAPKAIVRHITWGGGR